MGAAEFTSSGYKCINSSSSANSDSVASSKSFLVSKIQNLSCVMRVNERDNNEGQYLFDLPLKKEKIIEERRFFPYQIEDTSLFFEWLLPSDFLLFLSTGLAIQ